MTPYQWAWLALVAAALLALLSLGRAARGLPLPRLRLLLGVLAVTWVLLPAPIPNYPGSYAPALVVFVFEWLFQQNGDPGMAGRILAAGGLVVLAAGLIAGVWGRRRSHRAHRARSAEVARSGEL